MVVGRRVWQDRDGGTMPCRAPIRCTPGSRVKSGARGKVAYGVRRHYLCQPTVGKRHKFAVAVDDEEAPVVLFTPPPKCPVHGKEPSGYATAPTAGSARGHAGSGTDAGPRSRTRTTRTATTTSPRRCRSRVGEDRA